MRLPERYISSLQRPDFRQNPIRAVAKRIWWKLRWLISNRPWLVTLDNGLRIATPKSGTGALIYYLGTSEIATRDLLNQLVKPGMTVVDVGAHLGEFALRAARLTGTKGMVYAFEPQPEIVAFLEHNIQINSCTNVKAEKVALGENDGQVEFEITREPSTSSLAASQPRGTISRIVVETRSLDSFLQEVKQTRVDFMKVDVEGAEFLVFRGAENLLSQPADDAPVILFEYAPDNYQRFGFESEEVLQWLESKGYKLFIIPEAGRILPADSYRHLLDLRHRNLLASKNVERILDCSVSGDQS